MLEIDTRNKDCFDAKILCPFETTLIEINRFQGIVLDFVCLETIRNHCMHSNLTIYSVTSQRVVSTSKKKNGTLRVEHMFHGFQLLFVLLCRLTFRVNPCHFFFFQKICTRQRNFNRRQTFVIINIIKRSNFISFLNLPLI